MTLLAAYKSTPLKAGHISWVKEVTEPHLPKGWNKYVCMKNGRLIKKLVQYRDPEGKKYKNLKTVEECLQHIIIKNNWENVSPWSGFLKNLLTIKTQKSTFKAPNPVGRPSKARGSTLKTANKNNKLPSPTPPTTSCPTPSPTPPPTSCPTQPLTALYPQPQISSPEQTLSLLTPFPTALKDSENSSDVMVTNHFRARKPPGPPSPQTEVSSPPLIDPVKLELEDIVKQEPEDYQEEDSLTLEISVPPPEDKVTDQSVGGKGVKQVISLLTSKKTKKDIQKNDYLPKVKSIKITSVNLPDPTLSVPECQARKINKKFQCSVCHVLFEDKKTLMTHLTVHQQCNLCNILFKTKGNWIKHMEVIHKKEIQNMEGDIKVKQPINAPDKLTKPALNNMSPLETNIVLNESSTLKNDEPAADADKLKVSSVKNNLFETTVEVSPVLSEVQISTNKKRQTSVGEVLAEDQNEIELSFSANFSKKSNADISSENVSKRDITLNSSDLMVEQSLDSSSMALEEMTPAAAAEETVIKLTILVETQQNLEWYNGTFYTCKSVDILDLICGKQFVGRKPFRFHLGNDHGVKLKTNELNGLKTFASAFREGNYKCKSCFKLVKHDEFGISHHLMKKHLMSLNDYANQFESKQKTILSDNPKRNLLDGEKEDHRNKDVPKQPNKDGPKQPRKEVKGKESREKEAKEQELNQKIIRDNEAREIEAIKKEAKEREIKEKEAFEKEIREQEVKEQELNQNMTREKEAREVEIRKNEAKEMKARENDAFIFKMSSLNSKIMNGEKQLKENEEHVVELNQSKEIEREKIVEASTKVGMLQLKLFERISEIEKEKEELLKEAAEYDEVVKENLQQIEKIEQVNNNRISILQARLTDVAENIKYDRTELETISRKLIEKPAVIIKENEVLSKADQFISEMKDLSTKLQESDQQTEKEDTKNVSKSEEQPDSLIVSFNQSDEVFSEKEDEKTNVTPKEDTEEKNPALKEECAKKSTSKINRKRKSNKEVTHSKLVASKMNDNECIQIDNSKKKGDILEQKINALKKKSTELVEEYEKPTTECLVSKPKSIVDVKSKDDDSASNVKSNDFDTATNVKSKDDNNGTNDEFMVNDFVTKGKPNDDGTAINYEDARNVKSENDATAFIVKSDDSIATSDNLKSKLETNKAESNQPKKRGRKKLSEEEKAGRKAQRIEAKKLLTSSAPLKESVFLTKRVVTENTSVHEVDHSFNFEDIEADIPGMVCVSANLSVTDAKEETKNIEEKTGSGKETDAAVDNQQNVSGLFQNVQDSIEKSKKKLQTNNTETDPKRVVRDLTDLFAEIDEESKMLEKKKYKSVINLNKKTVPDHSSPTETSSVKNIKISKFKGNTKLKRKVSPLMSTGNVDDADVITNISKRGRNSL